MVFGSGTLSSFSKDDATCLESKDHLVVFKKSEVGIVDVEEQNNLLQLGGSLPRLIASTVEKVSS